MESEKKNVRSELADKYTRFRTHLRRSWINVQLHSQIKSLLKEKCNDDDYRESIIVDCRSPVGARSQANIRLRGKSLLGFVESEKGAGTEWALEWTLASSIALFEAFISDTATIAYLCDPERFLLDRSSQAPPERENYKISEIIIKSNSREEAIEKIAEEKLRGIFYGNPLEAFIKYDKKGGHKDGKLRLQLNDVFHNNCRDELKIYEEMIGRRNAIVHNAGIIDSKYIREVSDSPSKLFLKDKVKIDEPYLYSALRAMDKIATHYIKQVTLSVRAGEVPKNAKL